MNTSIVRQAAHYYSQGNYHAALRAYELLAERLGHSFFACNIALCKAKMHTVPAGSDTPPAVENLHNVQPISFYTYDPSFVFDERSCSQPHELCQEIINLATRLPQSNGSHFCKKIPLRVAIITDVYMFNFYKDVFEEIHYLTPDNYAELIEEQQFDMFLYVSCWQGISNNEWRGIKYNETKGKIFDTILDTLRAKGTKLVFQTIEDPSTFDYFLPIALKFDYIFTSDTDMIAHYKTACGHGQVYYCEYGANPHIHNPIGCRHYLINAAFFAGSWAHRYSERCHDMTVLFHSILEANGKFVIADRNLNNKDQQLRYPDEFAQYCIPPLDHLTLQAAHKLFRYNLNLNSIKNSPTMCAMRIYEMQAMGVGIYSNYAKSVFNTFPEIRIVPWKESLSIDFLPEETLEEYRNKMLQVRQIMDDKTAYDIADLLARTVGFDIPAIEQPVVAILYQPQDQESALASQQKQLYGATILVSTEEVDTQDKWQTFVQENNVRYFTWFAPQFEYEEGYISALINAFKYTNAKYSTHLAYFYDASFIEGPQHDYTSIMGGKAKSLFTVEHYSPQNFAELQANEYATDVDGGYAIDPFELNYIRYRERIASTQTHLPPLLSVIVPVYNNGRFLRAKCIASLMRNKLWERMEIILVDDGSTDIATLNIMEELKRMYPQIKTFSFQDAGSGSASHPRNKGIEIATAPYISFLDPDNEIAPEGYDILLQTLEQANTGPDYSVDFVSAYCVKVEAQAKVFGRHTSQPVSVLDNLKATFLENGKFPAIPTQPAILARHLFSNPQLRFVEKAAGQDTLFGWELLCHARKCAFTDSTYLIYYAQRADSIVNAIDRGYFEKKVILETEQVAMLKRYNLLEVYNQHTYQRFWDGWYLPKLALVEDKEEHETCAKLLEKIAQLYGKKFTLSKASSASDQPGKP